jgi:phosphate starvation-inducible PhoH-like protein
VQVGQRGQHIHLAGDGDRVRRTANLLDQLYAMVSAGHELRPADVRHGARLLHANPDARLSQYFSEVVATDVRGRAITPRTEGQRAYVRALRAHDVVFGVGPAGTGKTYLAIAAAVQSALRGEVQRIVLTRPAVEAGEKLGFLPGDLQEKVDPYLRPLFDALEDMLPPERLDRMFERNEIEIAPLAFMRGRTLADAFVILDEAQNTTVEQMRMFLTRLGDRSRMVITGDPTQVDLPPNKASGMAHAIRILGDVPAIGVSRFTSADVVRHPLVAEIIDAYERDDRGRRPLREDLP